MKAVVQSYEAGDKKEYAEKLRSEIQLVKTRLVWLECVVSADGSADKRLASLIKDATGDVPPEEGSDGVSSTSKDLNALWRAGPCPNFEQLVMFSVLEKHQESISLATTADQLTEKSEAKKSTFTMFNTLSSSCKTSTNDLASAYTTCLTDAKEAEHAAKEANKSKRKTKDVTSSVAKKPRPAVAPVLDYEGCTTIAQGGPDADFSLPFWLSGKETPGKGLKSVIAANESLLKELDDFTSLFEKSAERVTEGRASMRMSAETLPLFDPIGKGAFPTAGNGAQCHWM